MKGSNAVTPVVEEVVRFNADRKPGLVRLKFRRMAEDPFAFFRGTDHLFADRWPGLRPTDVGPEVWVCGDLHLENFGAYRADGGEFLYDVNDFDEALVAPCSLDLVRCATSILLAAQLWKFTPVQAMRTVLMFLGRYRSAVARSVKTGHVGRLAVGTARGPIWELLKRPVAADEARFLNHLTEKDGDGSRRIERGSGRFRRVGRGRAKRVKEAVQQYGTDRGEPGAFEVLDVAFRVAGIGSLGLRRYAVLVRGGGSPDRNRILDIKEARPPALLACAGAPQPDAGEPDARRVVRAQRLLQARPTAGLDVLAVDGQEYRMRELIPEENRTGLEQLRKHPRRFRRAVAVAGRLTGWAHVRGSRLDGDDRSGALGRWAAGPGLDAVIASAVRFAERTRRDYKNFHPAAAEKVLEEAPT